MMEILFVALLGACLLFWALMWFLDAAIDDILSFVFGDLVRNVTELDEYDEEVEK